MPYRQPHFWYLCFFWVPPHCSHDPCASNCKSCGVPYERALGISIKAGSHFTRKARSRQDKKLKEPKPQLSPVGEHNLPSSTGPNKCANQVSQAKPRAREKASANSIPTKHPMEVPQPQSCWSTLHWFWPFTDKWTLSEPKWPIHSIYYQRYRLHYLTLFLHSGAAWPIWAGNPIANEGAKDSRPAMHRSYCKYPLMVQLKASGNWLHAKHLRSTIKTKLACRWQNISIHPLINEAP